MKPHEETWEALAVSIECKTMGQHAAWARFEFDPTRIWEAEARAKLAAQAPAMARLLLKLSSTSCSCVVGCSCEHGQAQDDALTLLRAAGVIP